MFLPKVVAISFFCAAGTLAFAYADVYEQDLYARDPYPKAFSDHYEAVLYARDAYSEPYEHNNIYARAAHLENVIESVISRRAAEAEAKAWRHPSKVFTSPFAKVQAQADARKEQKKQAADERMAQYGY